LLKLKISVVTVSYNSAATIADTLRSVAAQTYTDIEHLIIDGQSSDKTMLEVDAHSHKNLTFSSEPDSGIYDAMNKGVQRATGDVIGILNSDDFYVHDNVLHEVATTFATDPTLDVVLGDVDFVKSSDLENPVRTYRASGFKTWMFRFGLMPPHPAVFVRKSAYERVGFYKMDYKIAADFDFLLRLLLIHGAKYQATGKHWVRMRTGGVSTSGWQNNVVITEELQRSLLQNNVFSSTPMLLLRLPVKFFRQIKLPMYF
jgi:glycosyltransferase involved in cell wall biosynthesis